MNNRIIDHENYLITLPNGARISPVVSKTDGNAYIALYAHGIDGRIVELARVSYVKASNELQSEISDKWDNFCCYHNEIAQELTYEQALELYNSNAKPDLDISSRAARAFARELARRDEAAKPAQWLKWFGGSADSSNAVKAECSSCGRRFDVSVYGAAFCPNCGRPMEVKS